MKKPQTKILLIEEKPSGPRIILKMLAGVGEVSTYYGRLTIGLERIKSEDPDIALIGLNHPDSPALETMALIEQAAALYPVIVLTDAAGEEFAARAISHGAQDYLIRETLDKAGLRRSIFKSIERNRIRRDLKRQTEERFRGVLENSLDAAFRRNLQTDTYDYISPVFEQITGISTREMQNMKTDDVLRLIHPDDIPNVLSSLNDSLSAGAGVIEYRFKTKNGKYCWLAEKYSVQKGPDGRPLFRTGIVRDVTSGKEVERALERKSGELENANRELESFSYSVSHDLRAPIGAVAQFSKILLDSYGAQLNEDAKKIVEIIRGNVALMDELVKGLLNLSRITRQEINKTSLDMQQISESLAGGFETGARRPEFRIADLPPAKGDAVLIRQVFANLISNAVKFSNKKRRPRIEIGGHENGEKMVYFVRDNGAGFKMKHYDRLFAVFQRLHNPSEFEGTGVGLATVQRIIHRHGGQVWAEGKVGKGATFFFSLPSER